MEPSHGHLRETVFRAPNAGQKGPANPGRKNLSIETLARQAGVTRTPWCVSRRGIPTRMEPSTRSARCWASPPYTSIEGQLVLGRDYDIKKHESSAANASRPRHVPRKDRVRFETRRGMTIGDLNYRLPGGRLSAKVWRYATGRRAHASGRGASVLSHWKRSASRSAMSAPFSKGDAIFFWGTEPHTYFNADKIKEVSVALSVVVGGEETEPKS